MYEWPNGFCHRNYLGLWHASFSKSAERDPLVFDGKAWTSRTHVSMPHCVTDDFGNLVPVERP